MTIAVETDTRLNVSDTRLLLTEEHEEDGRRSTPEVPSPELVGNVVFIDWAHVALPEPVTVVRTVADYPRGRQYRVDQETLETLAELPQPPDDQYDEE